MMLINNWNKNLIKGDNRNKLIIGRRMILSNKEMILLNRYVNVYMGGGLFS